jgi:hypothetical protein
MGALRPYFHSSVGSQPSRLLQNYLRGLCGVKNGLKMLIYFSKLERQPGPFSAILPYRACLENVFNSPLEANLSFYN